jgi:dynein heavy chain
MLVDKKKSLLIIKTVKNDQGGFPTGIDKEIVFMEITKPIIQNLYNACTEIFLPILGNPLNQIGWSDLVSKDLMEKFHQFLSQTYVTMGQVGGRTMLPLPANDATTSERMSSKDKAINLESM